MLFCAIVAIVGGLIIAGKWIVECYDAAMHHEYEEDM